MNIEDNGGSSDRDWVVNSSAEVYNKVFLRRESVNTVDQEEKVYIKPIARKHFLSSVA